MMTRIQQILILFHILLARDVEPKRTTCVSRFKDNRFDYCTKFGAPSNSEVTVSFKSRLVNHNTLKPIKKDNRDINLASYIEFGVYPDQQWDELQKLKNPSCTKRRDMASKILKFGVPVDGSWSNELDDYNLKE